MTHTALRQTAAAAKEASRQLTSLAPEAKDAALENVAQALENSTDDILEANRQDLQQARSFVGSRSVSSAALARMTLSVDKIQQMAKSVRAVAALKDPAGQVLLRNELDDGLELRKISCPFGVIAAVVEARPDAVMQLSSLAFKSGNSLMIKAGAEIGRTTEVLLGRMQSVFASRGVSIAAVANVKTREELHELLALSEYVDLVVPRGSAELVRFVSANTRIPVLGHADGVCHIYVDGAADLNMAFSVVLDSKLQAPATCNAVETVLVDRAIAQEFVSELVRALQLGGVKVRGCETSRALCANDIEPVTDTEWSTEYGGLVLAIRVVDGPDEAIAHINRFGSHHTDSIITEDHRAADRFLRDVDSAGVFHNVSTRFSDGYRYGLGAEVGISTGKLHARGPVGLEGLVTYKYVLAGRGQCVSQYVGPRARRFKHEAVSTGAAL